MCTTDKYTFSLLLEIQLLLHMVTTCLKFWDTVKHFSYVAALHAHQQYLRFPNTLRPHQYLSLSILKCLVFTTYSFSLLHYFSLKIIWHSLFFLPLCFKKNYKTNNCSETIEIAFIIFLLLLFLNFSSFSCDLVIMLLSSLVSALTQL